MIRGYQLHFENIQDVVAYQSIFDSLMEWRDILSIE